MALPTTSIDCAPSAALFVHELKTCSIGSASLVQEPNVEIDLGLKMPEAAGNASDALVTQERS